MIKWNVDYMDPQNHVLSGSCNTADVKPTECGHGSTLIDVETSKVYIFNAVTKTWREL